MDSLLQAQHDLYQRIGRTVENLKKAGASKLTLGLVQSAISLLDKKWAVFEAQHTDLRSTHWSELKKHEYYVKDFMSTAEEMPHAVETSLVSQAAPSRRTVLPKIKLPQFSSKYEDWPSFRDHFKSSIDSDDLLPTIEKLHYLRSCVQGEAATVIQNLPATEASYTRAWRELSDFYSNTQLLVRSYLNKFLNLPKMKSENVADLKRIFHGAVNTYDALENIERPIYKSEDLFVHLLVELLGPRSRELWDEHISGCSDPPSFDKLKSFLQRRLQTLDGRLAVKDARADAASSKTMSFRKEAKSHLAHKSEPSKKTAKMDRCSYCKGDHFLMFCEGFKNQAAKERKNHVSGASLCMNCLGKHSAQECRSQKSCTVCSERHHTLLHDAFQGSQNGKTSSTESTTSHIAQNHATKHVTILLATARVRVADRFGKLHAARALIDQGSETSFVSEALAQNLRLPRQNASVSVIGVGGNKTGVAKGRMSLRVMPHFSNEGFSVSALVLPRLITYTGGPRCAAKTWEHLKNLELADPQFLSSDKVDILLGADVFAAILQAGVKKGGPSYPVAQKTSLGWIISGGASLSSERDSGSTVAHQCITTDELSSLVKKFWEQEELQWPTAVLTEEERRCEDLYVSTHARTAEGRYMVRLPFARGLADFTTTRLAAVKSLASMERRFVRDGTLKARYIEFMHQYSLLGHMSLAEKPEGDHGNQVCYLPHHGVLRESSATTKLRVVFNGSATTPMGESLNKHLMTGKNLLPALTDILLRWRTPRYVMATDVEKMYRQILVHPEDRDLQRILWRYDKTDNVREYRLNTVTYGLACAPFLAMRTLKQLAEDEGRRYPLGAAVLLENVYVDDILTGADTLKEAQELQEQLISICNAGGFPLKKWTANHATLLAKIPPEDRLPTDPLEWDNHDCHAMLGLRWHSKSDSFSFAVKLKDATPITKRTVLSHTAQLFDPLGWLAPVIIRAKILIQSAWMQGLDWDTPMIPEDCRTWSLLYEELVFLEQIRIPRWISTSQRNKSVELHGFADASERAYAAVVYLKANEDNLSNTISLIAAKSKVAPLKQVSLPRLELCAATLLAQFVAYVKSPLNFQVTATHLWLDSTVALGWVRSHPSRWKTYVANRVAEIQRLVPDVQWHHVRSCDNPADCASRGVSPRELVGHHLWWHGPPWLAATQSSWPFSQITAATIELPEQRSTLVATAHQVHVEPELLLQFSSLQRLLRITAWCKRWLHLIRSKQGNQRLSDGIIGEAFLTALELEDAERTWIRLAQAENYKAELTNIKRGLSVSKGSSLTSLHPFIDEHGVLRVGGRIKHSLLPYESKHPAILSPQSHLTQLVVQACHRRTLHGGVQQTLGLLRQRFWVPKGRQAVKHQIHQCVTCVRWRAAPAHQIMADLPRQRVTPARPFQHAGVDYAGPIMLRTSSGRGHKAHKAFLVVFVCMSTRAVHLDVATNYSAEAFLAAFRRFVSRRGLCQTLYSDCGTNFVGADTHLRSLFSAGNKEARVIAEKLAVDRVQWNFNPPSAPHFGGLWEASVKSMKHHLRRVLGDTTLTYEEMATLLTQVEACLNSRPLQALTDDPDDVAALTPGHFLIGSALNAVPEKSLLEAPTNSLSRWQLVQQMRDSFWDRWSREYLQGLTHRTKWQRGEMVIEIGQLCLVRNENTPPTKWPLARVIRLHPGSDGRARVVAVKTAHTELVRPITKLILLPIASTDLKRADVEIQP